MHRQGHDTSIIEDCPDVFHVSARPLWEKKKKTVKKKEIYLQLTVTFTVLVSGEAMSFKALHS